MTFRLANTSLNSVSYSILYMLYGFSDEMWDVGDVVFYGSGILSTWDVRDVWMLGMWSFGDLRCRGFVILGVWDVRDVRYWRCEMLGMWYVRDVVCLGCMMSGYGKLGMSYVRDEGCSKLWMLVLWDFQDVGFWGCGMFRMWDVWDVGCWRCGIFGMWDVLDVGCRMWDFDLQNACLTECFEWWENYLQSIELPTKFKLLWQNFLPQYLLVLLCHPVLILILLIYQRWK